MENIRLEFYQEQYRQELEQFELEEEQEKFTAPPSRVFDTLQDSNRHFTLILRGEKAVGYFVLHEKEGPIEIGSHAQALLIRALAINKTEQRKGYALAAMTLLPDFVRRQFTDITELVLIVNHANLPAQRLYQKAGFTDTGIRRNGKIGLQYIFHRIL